VGTGASRVKVARRVPHPGQAGVKPASTGRRPVQRAMTALRKVEPMDITELERACND